MFGCVPSCDTADTGPGTLGHWAPELFIAIFAGGRQPQCRARVLIPVTWRIMPPPPSTATHGWIFFHIFKLLHRSHLNTSSISSNFPQLSAATLLIPWVIIPKIVKGKRMFGKNIHPCFHRDIYLVRCTQFSFIRYRNVGKRFVYFQDTAFIKFFSRRKVKLWDKWDQVLTRQLSFSSVFKPFFLNYFCTLFSMARWQVTQIDELRILHSNFRTCMAKGWFYGLTQEDFKSDDCEKTKPIVKINFSLKTFTSAVYMCCTHPRISDLTALFTLLVKLNEPEKCSAKPWKLTNNRNIFR